MLFAQTETQFEIENSIESFVQLFWKIKQRIFGHFTFQFHRQENWIFPNLFTKINRRKKNFSTKATNVWKWPVGDWLDQFHTSCWHIHSIIIHVKQMNCCYRRIYRYYFGLKSIDVRLPLYLPVSIHFVYPDPRINQFNKLFKICKWNWPDHARNLYNVYIHCITFRFEKREIYREGGDGGTEIYLEHI